PGDLARHLELAILVAEPLELELEEAARDIAEPAADLGAERPAEEPAHGGPGDRQCLLCKPLQHPAERLAARRADEAPGAAHHAAGELAQAVVELGLVAD